MPKCNTCTHKIPKSARTCPHCGFLITPSARAQKQAFVSVPPNIQQFHHQQQLHQQQLHKRQFVQPRGVYPQAISCYYHHCPHRAFVPPDKQSSSDVSALSVASLVLGIIALISSCMPFLGLPFGIAGIICGVACKDKKIKGTSMALAVMGIIFSILGLILSLAMLVFWLSTPSFESFPSDQFIF